MCIYEIQVEKFHGERNSSFIKCFLSAIFIFFLFPCDYFMKSTKEEIKLILIAFSRQLIFIIPLSLFT